MYAILLGEVVIGGSRLESPNELSGHAQGVLDPSAAFEALRVRVVDQATRLKAKLANDIATGRIDLPERLVDDMVDVQLLDDATGMWDDLRVVRADGSPVRARVTGFSQAGTGGWLVAVAINDGEYWRRAADRTL